MRIIRIVFVILSICLLLLLGWIIINTYVSIKYEIEPFGFDCAPAMVANDFALRFISCLKFFCGYIAVTVVLMLVLPLKKRKKDSEQMDK